MTLANIILVITAALNALVAGLIFACSVSITLGLARVSDVEYVSVMQSTNRAIQNSFFFRGIFRRTDFTAARLFFFVVGTKKSPFWLLLAAAVIYTVGVMGVTIFGNVPMNNTLDRFDLNTAGKDEVVQQRQNYELL